MREPTLVKSPTNAKPVTSVSAEQELSGLMRDSILLKSPTNAKPVTSVSAKQEI